jgi:hypothetical protein
MFTKGIDDLVHILSHKYSADKRTSICHVLDISFGEELHNFPAATEQVLGQVVLHYIAGSKAAGG